MIDSALRDILTHSPHYVTSTMRSHILATVSSNVLAIIPLLYVLIEYVKNLPVSNGRRQQLVDLLCGEARMIELLYGPPQEGCRQRYGQRQ